MKAMDVKEGDKVVRLIGGGKVWMTMRVVKVTEDRIICAADNPPAPIPDEALDELWQFDKATGVEEDEYLGWGVKFGVTGSYIKPAQA